MQGGDALATYGYEETCSELEILARKVAACKRCPAMQGRTQTVFGVGNVKPTLCFVGEAPGADEDKVGEPFVGRAGQLLNRIITACGLRREDVYICNILKCRPPNNRAPEMEEIAHCSEYLRRQLSLIHPRYICVLGGTAAKGLLGSDQPIGRLRGRFLAWCGIPAICTYHPAYLLRNPEAKALVWQDMQALMARIEADTAGWRSQIAEVTPAMVARF